MLTGQIAEVEELMKTYSEYCEATANAAMEGMNSCQDCIKSSRASFLTPQAFEGG